MSMHSLGYYAAFLDHSSLLPTDTRETIAATCQEAISNGYACICITPATLAWTMECLKQAGHTANVSAAIGFPHGTTTAEVKAFEAAQSCRMGANEIDMVMNINRARNGDWAYVQDEIMMVKAAMLAERSDAILKVIVETCLLTESEKATACITCIAAGADYIKTSTGFAQAGATVEDIRLFSRLAEGRIKVKASGGIRTAQQFMDMLDAGAQRIGTKFSQQILEGLTRDYGIKQHTT
jgi:deoxyribose-phosphate aldolase